MPTNKERHYILWNTLTETGSNNKDQTFDDIFGELDIEVTCNCFACQECNDRGYPNDCEGCPITPDKTAFSCLNGLFDKWHAAKNVKKRKMIARQIRDLPWRETE